MDIWRDLGVKDISGIKGSKVEAFSLCHANSKSFTITGVEFIDTSMVKFNFTG